MITDYMLASGTTDEALLRAGLDAFDAEFYLQQNLDVKLAGVDPFLHFLKHGWMEGRNPRADFSCIAYLRLHPELVRDRVNPFLHHVASQVPAKQAPQEVHVPPELQLEHDAIQARMDADFYRQQLNDGEQAPSVAVHYLTTGAARGLDPHPSFSTRAYLKDHPDVAEYGINPFYHFCSTGESEGRSASPSRWRPGQRPAPDVPSEDVQASVILGSPLNDEEYVTWNLKSSTPGLSELQAHYFSLPDQHRPPLTPIFSPEFYVQTYAAELPEGMDPYFHFLAHGFAQDFDPHPLLSVSFSKQQILATQPDLTEVSLDTFAQAILKDTVDPHPLYVGEHYALSNGDVRKAGVPMYRHFVQSGVGEGRTANEYFDANYYLDHHPDLPRDRRAATNHFFRVGDLAGERPGPMFDAQAYRDKYADQAPSGLGVLAHFIRVGKGLGRRAIDVPAISPSAVFEPQPINLETHATEIAAARQLLAEPRLKRIQGFEERDVLVVNDAVMHSVRARLTEGGSTSTVAPAAALPAKSHRSGKKKAHKAAPATTSPARVVAAITRPTNPLVSLIVPVYGCLDLVERCLISLYADTWLTEHCEFILADDHPTESARDLAAQFPGLLYLPCDTNLGFLRNCNRAVTHARGQAYLLVNSDLEIPTGTVKTLWDALQGNSQLAIAGPKILYPNGRLQEAGCLVRLDGSGQLVGVGDDPSAPEFSWSRDVDYLSGAFMLIRATAWAEVGGFDDALAPSYCEDLDLCLAVRNKGYQVRYVAEAQVVHHLSASHAELSSSSKLLRVATNQQKVALKWRHTLQQDNQVSILAYYLPQFHTTPENDLWWGTGFTEWINCTKARPNYVGHYQPHLPTDMGFYDLTAPSVIEKQAKLAQRYGVNGFCIHYYNFGGRRILETPTEIILANPNLEVNFCLCWANENWTKNWDGGDREVLLEQIDTPQGQDAVIADVIRHMQDPRYIRVGGRPLFVLYRPTIVSNLPDFARRFRAAAAAAGLPAPLLTATDGLDGSFTEESFAELGFDAGVEFSPHGCQARIAMPGEPLNENFRGTVFGYPEASQWLVSKPGRTFPYYRCAFPSWDNTPRRQNDGVAFHGATPEVFQAQVETLIRQTFESHPSGQRVMFVNAWNEWAEGTHLEPDRFHGHRWLEAIRNARVVTGAL